MELFIFKSDIDSRKKVRYVKPILNRHAYITEWSIDLEDVDNVLRVRVKPNLNEEDVMKLAKKYGFRVEPLPD